MERFPTDYMDYGIRSWIEKGSISDYTRTLISCSNLNGHLIAKGESNQAEFDPKVVCIAVEDMSTGNQNSVSARNFLQMVWREGDYLITSGAYGRHLDSEEIPARSVYGFLRDLPKGASYIGYRDDPEVLRELEQMGWKNPLHRIEDREEAILRGIWEALYGGNSPSGIKRVDDGKIYLVLDWRHFLDVDLNPEREHNIGGMKGYRNGYLIFDFLAAENIPHIVLAPAQPITVSDSAHATAWFSVISACNNYDTTLAEIQVAGETRKGVISKRRDLMRKEREARSKFNEWYKRRESFKSVEESETFRKAGQVESENLMAEISNDPEVVAAFQATLGKKKTEQESRFNKIKGLDYKH